jgi:hypothetical protein
MYYRLTVSLLSRKKKDLFFSLPVRFVSLAGCCCSLSAVRCLLVAVQVLGSFGRERAWVDKRANITRGYVCNRQPNTHSSIAFFFFLLSFSSSFTFHRVIRTRPSCPRDLICLVCVSLLSCITLSLSYTLIRLLCISFSWFWGISFKRNWVEYVEQKEETHITHSSLPI